MGDLECLLEKVGIEGNWSEEDIEKYFEISGAEETGTECPWKIRDYLNGDDIESLIGKVGNYDVRELGEEGYDIQVLEDGGKVFGMIATREDEGTRYVGAIAVDENFEGKGYMGCLIDAVYDGIPLTAKVSKGNPRAREAFEKYGFRAESSVNGWQWMIRR